MDASKLGSECKHDDVRERYILFVRDEGHVAPTKNQKETRSLRLKRDEEISFSLFTTKRKEFLATTEEKKDKEKKETQKEETKNPKHSIIQPLEIHTRHTTTRKYKLYFFIA